MNPMNPRNPTNPNNPIPVECIGIIGLGYVGLSLATAFGRSIPTVGFDINHDRIRELQAGHDRTGETPSESLQAPHLMLTHDPADLSKADLFIVTVPTPVDRAKRPDLSHLVEASRLLGRILKSRPGTGDRRPESGVRRPTSETNKPSQPDQPNQSDEPNKPGKPNTPIIVYESTVYPGCTEEVCIPVLEQESGLTAGKDFKVGYSPERINPGDPDHTLETIVKVVAGQDDETTEVLAKTYGVVVKAGVHKAPDIRTAEAAKVIENIQRDLNIALMNELAMLFHRLGIDMREVLAAARSKWNFLPFQPGLVGGHCIPVDPYYLTHKAQEIGYHPDVILAGRRINDSMGVYVAQETLKLLIKAGKPVRGARTLVLGATFKQEVRDLRNSRVFDLLRELENHDIAVSVYDPLVDPTELQKLNLKAVPDPFPPYQPDKRSKPIKPDHPRYDAVILAVPHRAFLEKEPAAYVALLDDIDGPGVLVDVKGVLPRQVLEKAGLLYWSL